MNSLQIYQETKAKLNALQLALATMNYDANTIAPIAGSQYRNEMMAQLSSMVFVLSKDPQYIAAMQDLQATTSDPDLKREIDILLENYNIDKNVPSQLQLEYTNTAFESWTTWQAAKKNNDYASYEPKLQAVITKLKEVISYYPIQDPYNALLNLYHRGLTHEKLESFFEIIQARLVPFIQQIVKLNRPKPAFLSCQVPIEKQREVTKFIRQLFDFPEDSTYISESSHPFSSTFSLHDSRITTRYDENNFLSNIYSIIHEIGHGTYNLQVNEKYGDSSISSAMSMSMHESQSRFLENNIARHPLFWKKHYPTLQKLLDPILNDVSLEEFVFGINYSTPSLIRTEADELTYPLHILIRYRLEKEIMTASDLSNLNTRWNTLYQEILGLSVPTDSEGILQDVHWSDGSLGYFPTYAMGSAYAAMFFEQIQKDLPLDELLLTGNYLAIKQWNKEHIHQYGAFFTDDEMIEKVCHKPFDANIYCDYLIDKFSRLYQLK